MKNQVGKGFLELAIQITKDMQSGPSRATHGPQVREAIGFMGIFPCHLAHWGFLLPGSQEFTERKASFIIQF